MKTSPKRAARLARRQNRTADRQDRRDSRQNQAPNFEDRNTSPPEKANRTPLIPLTDRQADYNDAIDASRITFGTGPAGTGKTYFATKKAAIALDKKLIKKIYLTRPAVEAGETLGFLPGELDEKYEPYLRPFKDALVEYFGASHLDYLIKKKIIEPVPLGFLRGATIKDAWLLADEMQNATKGQMKMLLTRMGKESKFIINGDPRQCDINKGDSGLEDAIRRVRDVENVRSVIFTHDHVVRDDIVADILRAYDD